jgi:carbon monoxide dehydrogenase subunit G
MEMSESRVLPVSQQTAWEALNDPDVLKQCIPGCESIERTGENEYALAMVAAVGPVKARFHGKLQLADLDPPRAYTLSFDGQGGAAGFGKGNAKVTLTPDGEARTKLDYEVHAQIGGKIAQIGSRLVDGAARKLAGGFFTAFDALLHERYPAEASADVSEDDTVRGMGGMGGIGGVREDAVEAAARVPRTPAPAGGIGSAITGLPDAARPSGTSTPRAMPGWGWVLVVVVAALVWYMTRSHYLR